MSLKNQASVESSIFLLVARDAGLQSVISDYQEDLCMAIEAAKQLRNALPPMESVTAEPWPSMRIREDI